MTLPIFETIPDPREQSVSWQNHPGPCAPIAFVEFGIEPDFDAACDAVAEAKRAAGKRHSGTDLSYLRERLREAGFRAVPTHEITGSVYRRLTFSQAAAAVGSEPRRWSQVALIARDHIATVRDGTLRDTWDSSRKQVREMWVRWSFDGFAAGPIKTGATTTAEIPSDDKMTTSEPTQLAMF